MKALLIIDMQNDFCPGGALAVNEGDKIVNGINKIMDNYDIVVATQDWHPENHKSFAQVHKKEVGQMISLNGLDQVLWPDHCVNGTIGAELHKELNRDKISMIIRKGMNRDVDSYSAFFDNDKKSKTGLDGYLNSLGVKSVDLVGLATDYCVAYSAMDAKNLGFETRVLLDHCRGVDFPENNISKAIEMMKENGIELI